MNSASGKIFDASWQVLELCSVRGNLAELLVKQTLFSLHKTFCTLFDRL